jgi:hypothetical protein
MQECTTFPLNLSHSSRNNFADFSFFIGTIAGPGGNTNGSFGFGSDFFIWVKK